MIEEHLDEDDMEEDWRSDARPRQYFVYCSKCKRSVDQATTEFKNIEEDLQGFDLLTFVCPTCGTTQKSNVRGTG